MRWSTVWLKHDFPDPLSGEDFTSVVAHKMGHVFRLYHHEFDGRPSSMYLFNIPPSPHPQGDDIGSADLCNGFPPPAGVRCVFGSVNTL